MEQSISTLLLLTSVEVAGCPTAPSAICVTERERGVDRQGALAALWQQIPPSPSPCSFMAYFPTRLSCGCERADLLADLFQGV